MTRLTQKGWQQARAITAPASAYLRPEAIECGSVGVSFGMKRNQIPASHLDRPPPSS